MSSNLIDVIVTAREDHTDAVSVFELTSKQGKSLPDFAPGAHIDVHISDDLLRQYSLSDVAGDGKHYRIGVLNDPNSRGGSVKLHELFNVGYELKISEPRNHFPLADDAKHSVLIGGGIGITPMIPMAYQLKSSNKTFELHYCSRNNEVAGFMDELSSSFNDQLVLHFDDLDDAQRLNPKTLFSDLADDTHIYVCGPEGFMDWVIEEAKSAGIPSNQIHFEYFNAEVETGGDEFEVYAAESDVTVTVGADQTIVQALAAVGVKIDVSCEQGVCGTCICDVSEGTPDHRDLFLTDEEKEDNDQIATCCSRAKSGRLVLEI